MRQSRREPYVSRLPDAEVLLRAHPWDFAPLGNSAIRGQTPSCFISDWRRSVSEPDLWRKPYRCRIPAPGEPSRGVRRETPPPTRKAVRCPSLSMTALLHRKLSTPWRLCRPCRCCAPARFPAAAGTDRCPGYLYLLDQHSFKIPPIQCLSAGN